MRLDQQQISVSSEEPNMSDLETQEQKLDNDCDDDSETTPLCSESRFNNLEYMQAVRAAAGADVALPDVQLCSAETAEGAEAPIPAAATIGKPDRNWLQALPASDLTQARRVLARERNLPNASSDEIAAQCAKLVEDLSSDEYSVRASATELLTQIGPAALPALVRAMGSSDRHLSREATKLAEPLLLAPGLTQTQRAMEAISNEVSTIKGLVENNFQPFPEDRARKVINDYLRLPSPPSTSKEDLAHLRRTGALLTDLANELQTRTRPPSSEELSALTQCSRTIADQQTFADKARSEMISLQARLTYKSILGYTSANDIPLLGKMVQRGLALGVGPDDLSMRRTLRAIMTLNNDKLPNDVLKAYTRAGGNPESLQELNVFKIFK
jgi:hypothetical protein